MKHQIKPCPQWARFFYVLNSLFALNSFRKEYPCLLFDVPTVSLPRSDKPIQAMRMPIILSNYNVVSHQHRWRCSACSLPKGRIPAFTGAAIGVVVGGVLVIVSQYCYENITAMPSSMSAWIANNSLHGRGNHFSAIALVHR